MSLLKVKSNCSSTKIYVESADHTITTATTSARSSTTNYTDNYTASSANTQCCCALHVVILLFVLMQVLLALPLSVQQVVAVVSEKKDRCYWATLFSHEYICE